jgi:glyoxylase-like metal-dependent hydrolase (beta-lactamase superfamily II)/8-oxo-dGTP pyrophosphatase MutT (NUDIX family)
MSASELAACVILSRIGSSQNDEQEILLVKKAKTLNFMGGYYVFPGGRVSRCDELLNSHADLDDGAQRSAALRELFEETGILLGEHHLEPSAKKKLRTDLLENSKAWLHFQQTSSQPLFDPNLHALTTWITPPCIPQQYHARYYTYQLLSDDDVEVWPGEIESALWITPRQAIQKFYHEGLELSYPVLETLRALTESSQEIKHAQEILNLRKKESVEYFGGEMFCGIYMIPVRTFTLPPATHTNTYLLGHEELVIVDPATPIEEEQDKLVAYLEFIQNQGKTLKEIWLTHQHKDHIGAVERIRKHFNCPLAAHPLTAQSLRGKIEVDRFIHDGDECTLKINDQIQAKWQAIHTPGHAHGHLCFFEKTYGSLISGDHIVGLGTVIIAPPEGNMSDYFASLKKLDKRPLNFMFPAHGPPIADSHAKIKEYIDHRTKREEAIFATLTTKRQPPEIVPLVYTELDPSIYPLAEINVRAHLEKLLGEKRITKCDDGYIQKV